MVIQDKQIFRHVGKKKLCPVLTSVIFDTYSAWYKKLCENYWQTVTNYYESNYNSLLISCGLKQEAHRA